MYFFLCTQNNLRYEEGGSPPRHTHTHDRRDAELAFHSYRLCWLNSWLKCVINPGQMNHSFIIYMSMSVVNKLATRFRHQFCIYTLVWRTYNTGIVLTWPGYFIKVFISYFSTLMYLQSQLKYHYPQLYIGHKNILYVDIHMKTDGFYTTLLFISLIWPEITIIIIVMININFCTTYYDKRSCSHDRPRFVFPLINVLRFCVMWLYWQRHTILNTCILWAWTLLGAFTC